MHSTKEPSMRRNCDKIRGVDAGRRSLVMLGGAAIALGASAVASAQALHATRPLKIVLHVSDPDGWPPALSTARNLSQKYPAVKVRVIADGGGVYGFQGSNDLVSAMAAAAKAGVEFQACHNALDEKRIVATSLPSFVKVVPAGVIALAEAQADGYAYIKP
jgi:intracellular sulfur oxidation DsrE/DsrF family protein